jgi:Right handed beta helix region
MRHLGFALAICAAAMLTGCATSRLPGAIPQAAAMRATLTSSGATLIISNQHHRTYKQLSISTLAGDCIDVEDSTDITIEASQIGPCGGNGISISGGRTIQILDSYVHPETQSSGCCDHNDSIFVADAPAVTIQGNVLAYGESNVEAAQHTKRLVVIGNFLLNPRGPFPRGQNVQAWGASDVLVDGNFTLSSTDTKRYKYPDDQEDSINFGRGSGFVAKNNYITGGHSSSGCGLIADDGANGSSFLNNRLVDTGGCGIGIASGAQQLVRDNKIVNRTPVPGAGNTALYVWSQYKVACGPVSVVGNIATELRKDGEQSGFWNGGGCSPVTLQHNVWNERAMKLLTPPHKKLPAPLIPPKPSHCVIESPYSTQTKLPRC